MIELKQEDKKELEQLVSVLLNKAISAYIDSCIYLTSYNPEVNTNQSAFVFRYSFYAIQQRLIIAVKKLLEPAKTDKITMFSIGKIIERPDFCDNLYDKNGIKYIYTDRLHNIFLSEHAERLKNTRNILCHNICNNDKEPVCYCKDFMNVLQECLNILLDVREQVLGLTDINFQQIKDLALKMAKDYWGCINLGAKETALTQNELKLYDKLVGNIQ